MLDQITPVLLTYNEAPNIARTLDKLSWAKEIMVVDSFSTDATKTIARSNPRVRWFERVFDDHATQWNFAIEQTGVTTPWILALDADYVLSSELIDELRTLSPPPDVAGYRARFRFYALGRPLRGTIYPPVTVLYRRMLAKYVQDGHTQRLVVNGAVEDLAQPICHDDRKSLGHWLRAQRRYSRLEAHKLAETPFSELSWPDRVRTVPFLSALPVLVYCMVLKRGALDGTAGAFYAGQRVVAELMIGEAVVEKHWSNFQHSEGSRHEK